MSKAKFDLRLFEAPGEGQLAEPHLRALPETGHIDVAPSVRDLTPYEAVSSQAAIDSSPDHHTSFKLDWNEATVAPSPRVTEAIQAHLMGPRSLNWYPQLGSVDLVDALTGYTGLPQDHLLVTNGSDDALHLICSTFLDQGDPVVIPVPTYNHFLVFAQSRGADAIKVVGASPFQQNLKEIASAMTPATRLLYLVSPNNPTGVVFGPDVVRQFCREYPGTLIVVDEAYFEFCQVTSIELVQEFPNLLVTRTFSKAFGLAGLRVGYVAGNPALLQGLRRMYNPKSVNTLGQVGAAAALQDLPYLEAFLAEVEESRQILRGFFERNGVEGHVTAANFAVVRMPDLATTLAALEDRGVYVRDRSSYPGLEGCLRMTLGTAEQTRSLLGRAGDLFLS